MNADRNQSRNKEKDVSLNDKESKESDEEEKEGAVKSSAHTAERNVMDTADVSRASIAKGIRAPEIFLLDIVKGTLSSDDVISYSTGIRPEDGKVIDPDKEVSIAKHLNKDIITNTEDVSKVASSGTSSTTESGGIDRAGIYSDDGTRHIERAQKTPTEIAEDNQTGSWKIKEKDEKRREEKKNQ